MVNRTIPRADKRHEKNTARDPQTHAALMSCLVPRSSWELKFKGSRNPGVGANLSCQGATIGVTLGKSRLHSVPPSLEGVGVTKNSPSLLGPLGQETLAIPSPPLQTSPRRTSGSRDSGTGAEARTPTCPCPRQQGRLAPSQRRSGQGLESQVPVTPNRKVWLPAHPGWPRHPASPCIHGAQWAWQPSRITQHRTWAKGVGLCPTLTLPSPLLTSRRFPFAGPGHSHCSVPEPSPVSLASYSWKKGQEMYLFFI